MSNMSWDKSAGVMRLNTNRMSGKPYDTPFDDSYTQQISDERHVKISNILQTLYPQRDIEIIGAPWDYSKSEDHALHHNTAIGHYRVKINGTDVVLCVNKNDSNEGLSLGHRFFSVLDKQRGLRTIKPFELPSQKFTQEIDGLFVNLEEFIPGTQTLFNTHLNRQQRNLGEIVALIDKVGGNLRQTDLQLDDDLRDYSNYTVMKSFKRGLEIIQSADDLYSEVQKVYQTLPAKLSDADLRSAFDDISGLIEKLPDLEKKNGRTAGTFNMIEKKVVIAEDGKIEAISSYDSAARGHVPNPTPNTSHDFGFAIARIVTNAQRYSDDAPETIEKGIKEFIEGYSNSIKKDITWDEAIESARITIAFNFVQNLGFNDLVEDSDLHTNPDAVSHLATSIVPVMQRLSELSVK